MRAKKSLGQHFLKSERALQSVIEAGELKNYDTVIEIGPGTGALTERLLETGAKVIAIEKDNGLFEFLKQELKKEIQNKKLELIRGDILDFKIENSKLKIKNYKLIANIPYNITGAVFKKFLEAELQPEKMVLLVQKEVAKRIIANDNKESILSVSVKAYGVPSYIETVKAGSFVPMPNVDSAIISINNISKKFFKPFSEKDFFTIVRAGFKSKRKKLSSNLSQIFPKDKVVETFQKLHLDENLRAEDVKIETWKKLAAIIYSD